MEMNKINHKLKLTEDDIIWFVLGDRPCFGFDEEQLGKKIKELGYKDIYEFRDEFLKRYNQYPENQEKAGKYESLMKANSEVIKNNISLTEAYQEIKQLKEELKAATTLLDNTSQTAGNLKKDYDTQWKQGQDFRVEIRNLKEKIEKLTIENCILSDFKIEVDSSFYMNNINNLDDLDVVLNNLKQKLEKIKEFVTNEILIVENTLNHPSWVLDEGELKGIKRVAQAILKILDSQEKG